MSRSSEDGILPALVERKFLSSNATSHEWMFGAIAELIDNACDPDVNANQFWVDVEEINGETCLTFTDNGNGMNTEVLHHMLSFGFSDKQEFNGRLPIGRYGNGFKSGSMRLGRDTLVFSCQNRKMSIGMLSQTYLEKIDSKTVLVPIVTLDEETNIIFPPNTARSSLEEILKYSLFSKEEDLFKQIECIPYRRRRREGTKIIIYNLAKDEKGNLELDFSSESDIRLSAVHEMESANESFKNVSKYRTSLMKYISILYMKPPMQVFLRKKKVKTICIKRILTHKKISTYTPKGVKTIHPIKILFGINPEQDEYGMMMYHRNRLIQAFRKNSFPKKMHDNGEFSYQQVRDILETVIGVVECGCLTLNHIKQNFQDDSKFRNIETHLKSKLWQYCVSTIKEIEAKKKSGENQEEKDTWVQCDNPACQKWRKLPFPTKLEDVPENWICEMNPDKSHNKCSDPEEPEERKIPRLSQGKKGRRSTKSSSERSSPTHTSETENTSKKGTITRFLTPQDTETNSKRKLLQYYLSTALKEIDEKKKSGENQKQRDTWIQCNNPTCQKWRKIPFPTKLEDLPENWICEMNPDKSYSKCSDPEEPDEELKTPRLSQGKKRRRSTDSISERSSPTHTSEIENTPERFSRFLAPQHVNRHVGLSRKVPKIPNKDSGHSVALERIRENLQENDETSSPTDDPDEIPPRPKRKLIYESTYSQIRVCLQDETNESNSSDRTKRKSPFPNSSNDVDERDASKTSTSYTNGDFDKDFEEIEMGKTGPELIVIDDDNDDLDDTDNNGKKLANEKSVNELCHNKLTLEPSCSREDNQDENNFVFYSGNAVVKQEKENDVLAPSDDTLEASDTFNLFLQSSPIDQEMSNLNENLIQGDARTSSIPTQPVLSWKFVEELKSKYEQKIAELQQELEHERERANALENRLKYYERDEINGQDPDVIIVEEYS